MHTLAAAQHVAVSASATAAPLFRHALPSYETLFRGTRLRIRRNGSVGKSGTIWLSAGDSGHDRLAKKTCIQCLASRKDRREMAAGEVEFEPDIASLKTGFSKRFPGEDTSAFEYFDDSDDDGVEVKSFKGGDKRRSPTSSSNAPRDKSSNRTGNKPDNTLTRRRLREEVTGNERSRVPGNDRLGAGFRDSRNYRGTRGEVDGSSGRSSAGLAESPRSSRDGANVGGRPRVNREADEARSSRSFGETRGDDSTSRTFREGSRSVGTTGNSEARNASDGSKPVRKGRAPYGGAEWSKDTPIFEDDGKKKKPVIEPVNFTSAMNKSPHVAILGGGMSGLVCALTLEEHGIQSTVFDTGKHGLGGRMATRYKEDHDGARLVFDHAAQYFTVTDSRFQHLVDGWILEGYVKKWNGTVGTLNVGGQYSELAPATRYIGTNGMRSLADSMLSQSRLINVKRPCWISRMDAMNGLWKLTENRTPQGEFDVVVIAHNGKCANRLLSTAHVPLVATQMKRLELSSIWALLAAFKEPLPLPGGKILDGAFVDGVDSLSWIGNNSSKLLRPGEKTPQCWTFLSTAAYGKRNKVPQESIPIAKAQKVKHDLLHGVEAALGLPEDTLPTPVYTHLQLWGAALPTNTPDVPCIFDAQGRVGICGDWLVGSSLEGAALSGMALADHIAKYRDQGDQDGQDFNTGLQQSFSSVTGSDIGQFPGTEESPKQSQEVLATA